jgi:hypothetical protein
VAGYLFAFAKLYRKRYDAAHHLNIHVNRHHGTTLENSKNNVTLLTITSISGIIVAKETVAIATAVNEVSTC